MVDEKQTDFNIGDKVIREDGEMGTIVSICSEPSDIVTISTESGTIENIPRHALETDFFMVGKRFFIGNRTSIAAAQAEVEYWREKEKQAKERLAHARKKAYRVKAMHEVRYEIRFQLNSRVEVKGKGYGIVQHINVLNPPYPCYGILLDNNTNGGTSLYYCGTDDITEVKD